MSIHVSGGGSTRRVVLSCDVAGCPVQVEPPPAERWRSNADALSWARTHANGWAHDSSRGTDYCPEHVAFSTPSPSGAAPPRPTAAITDAAGNPLNRDDYAAELRALLSGSGQPERVVLTEGQAEVAARLLDELAGVYRDEELGALASDLAALLISRTASNG